MTSPQERPPKKYVSSFISMVNVTFHLTTPVTNHNIESEL